MLWVEVKRGFVKYYEGFVDVFRAQQDGVGTPVMVVHRKIGNHDLFDHVEGYPENELVQYIFDYVIP